MYAYYAAIRNGTGRDIMIKLLIVDDEPLVQIGIKSMLRWDELGIEVCGTAMNGKAALEMIRQYRPDIVITDIKMPVMNGLELVKICRDEFGPIPLFIILTSFEEFSLIKEAMSYQAVDYLIKLELDVDDGRAVYEGELREGSTEYEFEIDAVTGSFLKWEQERD